MYITDMVPYYSRRLKNRSSRLLIAGLAILLLLIYGGFHTDFHVTHMLIVSKYNSTVTVDSYMMNSSNSSTDQSFNSSNVTTAPLNCGYLVRLKSAGRLGNQMFVYASFYGMVRKLKADKVVFTQVDRSPSLLDDVFENLSIPQRVVSDQWLEENRFRYVGGETGCCMYDPVAIDEMACDGENVRIDGWRQSYKYFDHVTEEVKREFTFKPSVLERAHRLFEDSLAQNALDRNACVVIGVHLRRGDAASEYEMGRGRVPAREQYLEESIRFYETYLYGQQNSTCLVFMVFGDDFEWNVNATEEADLLQPNSTSIILIDHRNSTPAVDLCTMSLCDHMIITTGTYSWWAGFFSRGMVVRQKEFAIDGSVHAFQYRIDDYFPPSWIPL